MSVTNADGRDAVAKIVKDYDTFLFDCDGVLWSSGHIFDGAGEAITRLRRLGKRVLYVTNNSTKTRAQYLKKICDYGIEAALGDIFCTAFTSALCLKRNLGPNDEVYVVGNPGMGAELDNVGIKHTGIGPDSEITGLEFDTSVPLNPNVKVVLAGMDGHFSYSKLTKATSYLAREGSLYVATNTDAQFPLKNSEYKLPGTGAIICSINTAAGRDPDVMCGKPGSFMMDCIKAKVDFDPKRAIMVGDRLDTDILFGKNNGISTMVMMSGVTSHERLKQIQQSQDENERKLIPDFYLESIQDLPKYLE